VQHSGQRWVQCGSTLGATLDATLGSIAWLKLVQYQLNTGRNTCNTKVQLAQYWAQRLVQRSSILAQHLAQQLNPGRNAAQHSLIGRNTWRNTAAWHNEFSSSIWR